MTLSLNETAKAWQRVTDFENAGRHSQAADARGALTGELYETLAETRTRELREEREHAVVMRGRTDLSVNVLGEAGVEVASLCDGLRVAGQTRLMSAVRAAAEALTAVAAPAFSSFDEPHCVALDVFPADRIDELAAALVARGYRSAVARGASWKQQLEVSRREFNGQEPRGGGSEAARLRDLDGVVWSDFPIAGPTRIAAGR